MPAYRFYTLPRISSTAELERVFFDDKAALRWGFQAGGEAGMEVWEGSRFVGRVHSGVVKVAAIPD